MPFGSLGYRMNWLPPPQNRGKLRRTGEGLGNPSFFMDPPLQCLPQRYIWGVATKKPAEEAGRVMGSLNITSNAATCSVDV